jgi:hypothetical protein
MDHVAEDRVTDIAGLHACPAYRLPRPNRRCDTVCEPDFFES